MLKILEPFILAFIPIFVAVDAIGNLPLFVSLVDGATRKQRRKIIIESVTTATAMAVVFMFVGKFILRLLNISIPDFQVAGGLLLLVISIRLLLPGAQKSFMSEGKDRDVGVFPLGTPLITGPAVLTTTIIMLDAHGILATFVSLALNMLIVWFTLIRANDIMAIVGANGTRAFSKIMYILLAAIAVMMMRHGITGMLVYFKS
jgi:multiple antibiotic resistance protein